MAAGKIGCFFGSFSSRVAEVPGTPKYSELKKWATQQRLNRTRMTPSQYDMLQSLDFTWVHVRSRWDTWNEGKLHMTNANILCVTL